MLSSSSFEKSFALSATAAASDAPFEVAYDCALPFATNSACCFSIGVASGFMAAQLLYPMVPLKAMPRMRSENPDAAATYPFMPMPVAMPPWSPRMFA